VEPRWCRHLALVGEKGEKLARVLGFRVLRFDTLEAAHESLELIEVGFLGVIGEIGTE
jgi:hypothetical protein